MVNVAAEKVSSLLIIQNPLRIAASLVLFSKFPELVDDKTENTKKKKKKKKKEKKKVSLKLHRFRYVLRSYMGVRFLRSTTYNVYN